MMKRSPTYLSSTIDETQLHLSEDTPAITGQALETLLNEYNQTQTIKNRLQQIPRGIRGAGGQSKTDPSFD